MAYAACCCAPAGHDHAGFRIPGTPDGALPKGLCAHYAERNVSPDPRSPVRRLPRPKIPESRHFLDAVARTPNPADQTVAFVLTHTGAQVSEALAVLLMDGDFKARSIRIRTLKLASSGWPFPILRDLSAGRFGTPDPEALHRALARSPGPSQLVPRPRVRPALRSVPAKAAGRPLWPWSWATAHLKIARIMADASRHRRPPSLPEGSPAQLRHRGCRCRRAAPDGRGRPGSCQPADHRGLHHRCWSRDTGVSRQDVEMGGEFGQIRRPKASEGSS